MPVVLGFRSSSRGILLSLKICTRLLPANLALASITQRMPIAFTIIDKREREREREREKERERDLNDDNEMYRCAKF